MQFKSVYTTCATYNEEFGLLALALIDKEVKIYRVKQNGAKITFVEHISFYVKFPVPKKSQEKQKGERDRRRKSKETDEGTIEGGKDRR